MNESGRNGDNADLYIRIGKKCVVIYIGRLPRQQQVQGTVLRLGVDKEMDK